uniref:Uncharacterized protein n=1 Tax=Parascaris univalens TaxID=6257 RepID=A0A914ZZN3_PARUN
YNYDISAVVTRRLNVYFIRLKLNDGVVLFRVGKAGDVRDLLGVHLASFEVFGRSVRKHSRRHCIVGVSSKYPFSFDVLLFASEIIACCTRIMLEISASSAQMHVHLGK